MNIFKFIKIQIYVLLIFLFLLSHFSFAYFAEVVSDKVHVRSGPSTDYPIIKTLERGEVIKVGRSNANWTKLSLPKEAWVFSKFLKISENFEIKYGFGLIMDEFGYIKEVLKGSPAAKAGIKKKDGIYSINGENVHLETLDILAALPKRPNIDTIFGIERRGHPDLIKIKIKSNKQLQDIMFPKYKKKHQDFYQYKDYKWGSYKKTIKRQLEQKGFKILHQEENKIAIEDNVMDQTALISFMFTPKSKVLYQIGILLNSNFDKAGYEKAKRVLIKKYGTPNNDSDTFDVIDIFNDKWFKNGTGISLKFDLSGTYIFYFDIELYKLIYLKERDELEEKMIKDF